MKNQNQKICIFVFMVILCGIYICPGFAVTHYDIILPGYPPTGQLILAANFNDLNQIVGPTELFVQTYLWENGTKTDLPFPMGFRGNYIHDINNAGHSVGGAETTASGLLYDGTSFTNLGTLGGSSSVPYAINENDQVVGKSKTSTVNEFQPFIWETGMMRSLGSLGGIQGIAYDINNYATAVGYSKDAAGKIKAFVCYYNQPMIDIGTLGGTQAVATAVNDANDVVGWAEGQDGYEKAFLWKNGTMSQLPSLGGNRSRALGINNDGLIVGWAETKTGYRPLVLWEEDTVIRLHQLIETDSGWQLIGSGESNFDNKDILHINNNACILGSGFINGSSQNYFLMTPRMKDFFHHDSDHNGIVNLNDFSRLSEEWMQ